MNRGAFIKIITFLARVQPASTGKKSKLGIWGVGECTVITRMWSWTSIPQVDSVRDLGAAQVQASGPLGQAFGRPCWRRLKEEGEGWRPGGEVRPRVWTGWMDGLRRGRKRPEQLYGNTKRQETWFGKVTFTLKLQFYSIFQSLMIQDSTARP